MANQSYLNEGLVRLTKKAVADTGGDSKRRGLALSGIRTGITLAWEMVQSTKPQERKEAVVRLNEIINLASDPAQYDGIDGLMIRLNKMEWSIGERQLRAVLVEQNGSFIRDGAALIYEDEGLIGEADGLSTSDEKAKNIRTIVTEQRRDLDRLEIIFDRRQSEGRKPFPVKGIPELFRRDRMFAMAGSRERR